MTRFEREPQHNFFENIKGNVGNNKKQFLTKCRAMKVKNFLQTCADTIDTTCVQFCSTRGSPVVDDDEAGTNINIVKYPTRLAHLARAESLQVHLSDEDLKEFACEGGFFDGTFAFYENDSWHVDVTMTEIPTAEMDDISPTFQPKMLFPRWGDERPGWWSSLPTSETPRRPWTAIWD